MQFSALRLFILVPMTKSGVWISIKCCGRVQMCLYPMSWPGLHLVILWGSRHPFILQNVYQSGQM